MKITLVITVRVDIGSSRFLRYDIPVPDDKRPGGLARMNQHAMNKAMELFSQQYPGMRARFMC
jgi:hypothetical protein